MAHTALIIDDEADIRELIAMSLDRIGLETHTAANLAEARNLLDTYKFDVCLSDMKLPDGNGLDFVKHVASVQPDLPVAIITAHGNMDAAVEAMKNGAFDFVSKPVDLVLLRSMVAQAVKVSEEPTVTSDTSFDSPVAANDSTLHSSGTAASEDITVATSRKYPKEIPQRQDTQKTQPNPIRLNGEDRLIGRSGPMNELKSLISKVARTNAPVWITGESGTGKELIAKLVHDNGPRSDAPFVAINCGAIPTELMESEMFGHRKGSFTGAHNDHDGLFVRAEGGTLFLDEVAELPLHMQVKLLRAIQERKVRPVGESEEKNTNVRILSASHTDLASEVEHGRFRHDLYYRLNVICIRAPSLRQRGNDVITIAHHILQSIKLTDGANRTVTLSQEAEDILRSYQFPGNVRELENILERAVALSETNTIEACDLNLRLDNNLPTSQMDSASGMLSNDHIEEKQIILDMLSKTRWNRKAAAINLGMTYRQLRYRIKQYELENNPTKPQP